MVQQRRSFTIPSLQMSSSEIPFPEELVGATVADTLDFLLINQEITLPLRVPGGNLRDQRCQLSVHLLEPAKAVHEILNIAFFLNVVPAFDPVTVHCMASML